MKKVRFFAATAAFCVLGLVWVITNPFDAITLSLHDRGFFGIGFVLMSFAALFLCWSESRKVKIQRANREAYRGGESKVWQD